MAELRSHCFREGSGWKHSAQLSLVNELPDFRYTQYADMVGGCYGEEFAIGGEDLALEVGGDIVEMDYGMIKDKIKGSKQSSAREFARTLFVDDSPTIGPRTASTVETGLRNLFLPDVEKKEKKAKFQFSSRKKHKKNSMRKIRGREEPPSLEMQPAPDEVTLFKDLQYQKAYICPSIDENNARKEVILQDGSVSHLGHDDWVENMIKKSTEHVNIEEASLIDQAVTDAMNDDVPCGSCVEQWNTEEGDVMSTTGNGTSTVSDGINKIGAEEHYSQDNIADFDEVPIEWEFEGEIIDGAVEFTDDLVTFSLLDQVCN